MLKLKKIRTILFSREYDYTDLTIFSMNKLHNESIRIDSIRVAACLSPE